MWSLWASTTSGFSDATAELVTTTSAPAMFSAAWPSKMMAPKLARRWVTDGILQIGTGNFVAKIQQHLGNTAHADATDADEMNTLNLGKHSQ